MNDESLREIRRIAGFFDGRWNRSYAPAKLRSDPVYSALTPVLADSALPLLDVGCGIGLLAFHLRARGIEVPIHGIDYDAAKIKAACRAVLASGYNDLRFDPHDVRDGLPGHQGNVCILDILQYLRPAEQELLMVQAAQCVPPGGRLAIRSGLRDASWRFKVTVAGDWLARATRWMKSAPNHYPTVEDFHRILSPFGVVDIGPLWGGTPFNNHLIVLRR